MSKTLIPADTKLAAKRGFLRTAAQTLSSAIPTAGVTIYLTGDFAIGAAIGALTALVNAALAGAASFLSITAKGIPADYEPRPDWEGDPGV